MVEKKKPAAKNTKKTAAKKKQPVKKKAQPKALNVKAAPVAPVVMPKQNNMYYAGTICLLGALLHILLAADSHEGVGRFFDFSLLYFMILLPIQAVGAFWLFVSRSCGRTLAYSILMFCLLDLYIIGRFMMQLFYGDLTMCQLTNFEPSYCQIAHEVSFAHLLTAGAMSAITIALLVKFKLLNVRSAKKAA